MEQWTRKGFPGRGKQLMEIMNHNEPLSGMLSTSGQAPLTTMQLNQGFILLVSNVSKR